MFGERDIAECLLMVQTVIRSIPHGGPVELFLIPLLVFYNWCKRCVYYPVRAMVNIKYPLLLIRKSSLCRGGSRFSLFYFLTKHIYS